MKTRNYKRRKNKSKRKRGGECPCTKKRNNII